MKPLKKLYREIVSLENLCRAAHATLARGRRYYGEGASFSFHLEREVSRLHRDLAAGAYRHGRYQIFQIRDPKPRTLAAAGFRDRVLHHAVHDVVEPGLDPMFIFESYACRKGTHRALDRIHHFPARQRSVVRSLSEVVLDRFQRSSWPHFSGNSSYANS